LRLDVEVATAFKKPRVNGIETEDYHLWQLTDVFDYGLLAQAALAAALKKPKNTESLLDLLRAHIIRLGGSMAALTIKVHELNAHESGFMGAAEYTQSDTFETICPRCRNGMLCYKAGSCWCKDFALSDRSRLLLARQYDKKCVCAKCLDLFGNQV
jgi:hypothetical protein